MKSGLTQKQILQKETRMVYLYNKSNTRKIKLCKENIYCWYDCIDEEGYKYELKSVRHMPGKFTNEYMGNNKLDKGENFRIIYHFLNDDLYYIDSTNVKEEWRISDKDKMAAIPFKSLIKIEQCFL
jgi:hypothetical protein